ncbi:hypothetical protein Phum_PHUM538950 [Pediculus humanus corporis]|uniref:Uncharacterized protein n=1 Tax=Pediculus humanus subsp. corporis TaxID=121224 RepID=E0VZV7_PEDHC|nr:uncharacterized protein Phum_PHUM538950 [Pediculus humanus corporis]EEB18913.1 hypothetical protein Phum_PHUM538950 [Pediculus humanus corporis]
MARSQLFGRLLKQKTQKKKIFICLLIVSLNKRIQFKNNNLDQKENLNRLIINSSAIFGYVFCSSSSIPYGMKKMDYIKYPLEAGRTLGVIYLSEVMTYFKYVFAFHKYNLGYLRLKPE